MKPMKAQLLDEIKLAIHATRLMLSRPSPGWVIGLAGAGRRKKRAKRTGAVSRPGEPFNTWCGPGKRPNWLRRYLEQGRLLKEFEVSDLED